MTVIHSAKQTRSQQFGEFPRICLVRFRAFTQQFVSSRITYHDFAHIPAHDVVHPSRLCRFLERYMQRSTQALQESNYRCRLGRHDRFQNHFAFRV
jgi:hypothetical protein